MRGKDKQRHRYVLFYVYGDGDDEPYIIINPPRKLAVLLKRWNQIDRDMFADGPLAKEWDYVNVWLEKQGINIVAHDRIVCLADYQPKPEKTKEHSG